MSPPAEAGQRLRLRSLEALRNVHIAERVLQTRRSQLQTEWNTGQGRTEGRRT